MIAVIGRYVAQDTERRNCKLKPTKRLFEPVAPLLDSFGTSCDTQTITTFFGAPGWPKGAKDRQFGLCRSGAPLFLSRARYCCVDCNQADRSRTMFPRALMLPEEGRGGGQPTENGSGPATAAPATSGAPQPIRIGGEQAIDRRPDGAKDLVGARSGRSLSRYAKFTAWVS